MERIYIAIDLGAESGRGIIGNFDENKIYINEIHRFSTYNSIILNHRFWNVLSIFEEIKKILSIAKDKGEIAGIGVTTWGVDCGFIGENNLLLSNPFHYRDERTNGIMEEVFQILPKERIFKETGIQFMPLNTLFQLYATKKEFPYLIDNCKTLLFMPDLFNFFLTGEKFCEYTITTTSQMYNSLASGQNKAPRGNWCYGLLEELGIKTDFLPQVISSGTLIGNITKKLQEELTLPSVPVFAVCCHDTASAVVGTPAKEEEKWAYLSSGTWSLLGVEIDEPIINEKGLEYNFTNEGGFGGTIRFLKNIMGLWILQECKKEWDKTGNIFKYEELVEMAKNATPFYAFIDVNNADFLYPGNMIDKIKNYCKKTGQKIPEDIPQIVRVIFESLAMEYRYVIEKMEEILGYEIEILHIVGGGSKNSLLSQFAASSTKKIVITGPSEATSVGNLLIQALARREIKDISQVREIIRNSFPLIVYRPENVEIWDENYQKYLKLKSFHYGL
ncbi:MAG TPA: rhamnulokinase family protein [bacterium]|nr:rhamnulokinase family protein [bacterium]HOM27587.1 rhamnulokinase family protein [bacterium]